MGGMFWMRRKTGPTQQQVLGARPVQLVAPTVAEAADGGVRLTVRLRPRLRWNWLFRVPEGATKTYELDAMGRLVWDLCDGKTSVQQIIRKVASRYNLNLREAEVSTRAFLNMLTRRGLIGVPAKA